MGGNVISAGEMQGKNTTFHMKKWFNQSVGWVPTEGKGGSEGSLAGRSVIQLSERGKVQRWNTQSFETNDPKKSDRNGVEVGKATGINCSGFVGEGLKGRAQRHWRKSKNECGKGDHTDPISSRREKEPGETF